MTVLDIPLYGIAAIVAFTLLGGVMRGFTGGAGATIVIMPILSAFVGAREAVPVGALLMLLTAVQLGRGVFRDADMKEAIPLTVAAILAVPVGAWILFTIDETTMRRIVAGFAILLAMVLLSGWRHSGPRGPVMAGVAGGLGGLIGGAVGMGGPPVFLYVMSGPSPAHVHRATIAATSSITPIVAIVALAPAFFFGTWAGTKLFGRVDEVLFRRLSLGAMIAVSLMVLVL